jgi:DNA invertase Pin-like site-specific DNA recombinase
MTTTQIRSSHRERLACVYVRQSTPGQVRHHQESTERQYRLRTRATELGWSPTAVEVIDEDQGRSGSTAEHRTGFQRLVSQVSLGKVGLVLMLEASRLARNNSDWHQLIEICGLRGTLIADEGAVYDPREPNDRLLLGVKGTLSEAELFTLRTRLYEGRWNKAHKGLLWFPLPVGYVRGKEDRWELDPDGQVRERLGYLFAAFRRLQVARAVVRDLKEHGLLLPTRAVGKEEYGSLVWKAPTLSAVVRILSNPAYAGAYVFGRWDYAGERRSAKTGKRLAHRRPAAEWPVCLRDHHPGYLTWEEYVQNRELLRNNWGREGRPGVAREGAALLQGLVFCGLCGGKMGVQNRAEREKRSPSYLCERGYQDGDERICQTLSSRPVDRAVVEAFLEAVTPLQLEVGLRVLDQLDQAVAAQRRQWDLQLEQARYEARLAQRQYDQVDPDNRLVAAELERRWNERLERVAQLEQAYAQAEQKAHWNLTSEERVAIRELAQDLPAVWQADTTTNRERKQLLRYAIEAVQLDGRSEPGQIGIQIQWRSGTVSKVTAERPRPGEGSLKTPNEAVSVIRELAPTHTYAEIAHQLNSLDRRTAFGLAYTSQHVGYLCRRHGWGRLGPRSASRRVGPRSKARSERDGGLSSPKSGESGIRGAL